MVVTDARPTSFPQRIRAARALRSLRQADLAAQCGLNLQTISQLELGRREPTLSTVRKLARALGVPLDWLIGESE